MKISAKVINHKSENAVSLITGDNHHSLMIPAKPDGRGSSVNGGELLFLALATCYCNDLYREAKSGISKLNGLKSRSPVSSAAKENRRRTSATMRQS